jgi:hypothetical protein
VSHKLNRDQSAVVTPKFKWLPIDDATPIGARMLLIERRQNICYVRTHQRGDGFTHWAPLPTFED